MWLSSVRVSSPTLRGSINEPRPTTSPKSIVRGSASFSRVSSSYSCFEVKGITYRPPGTQLNILNDASFSLPEKSFGLIFGQSGSGKTTLLQILAGLSKPTSGSIYFQRYGIDGDPNQPPEPLSPERVGIVFQFPERYFLADTVLEEVTFGWPRHGSSLQLKEQLAFRLQTAINWVGLNGIPLDKDPHTLSGGYKRRLALAVQLVQIPDLLILDEPLAGLDWKARADVVKLLKHLKKELTLLVVSHDLKFFCLYSSNTRSTMSKVEKGQKVHSKDLMPMHSLFPLKSLPVSANWGGFWWLLKRLMRSLKKDFRGIIMISSSEILRSPVLLSPEWGFLFLISHLFDFLDFFVDVEPSG